MQPKFVEPKFKATAYTCPHCGAYAGVAWIALLNNSSGRAEFDPLLRAECLACGKWSVWVTTDHKAGAMLFPAGVQSAPAPHPDMPAELVPDYEEARAIVSKSPRGAAALLRLLVQKLCKHLGKSGESINEDIKALVKDGQLPVDLQRVLDSVRVIGNEAVHPGTLDVRDSPELVHRLFGLVNLVVDYRIAKPKEIAALYSELPEDKREAIEKRDGK